MVDSNFNSRNGLPLLDEAKFRSVGLTTSPRRRDFSPKTKLLPLDAKKIKLTVQRQQHTERRAMLSRHSDESSNSYKFEVGRPDQDD